MRRVERGAFLAPSLSAVLNTQSLSKQDRAFITDLSYGTLRNLRYLDKCLEPRLKNPNKLPQDIQNILRLGYYELLVRQTPKHAAVNEWVEVSKKHHKNLAGLVNAVLKRSQAVANLSPAQRHSIPDWLYQDWETLFGDNAEAMAAAMNEPEPLWVYAYSSEVKNILEPETLSLAEGPLENTFALQPKKPFAELSAFKQGLIGAQNPASTVPVRLLQVKNGEAVLDLASGNGIKSAQLASLGAKVSSVELATTKVKRAKKNLKRLGLAANHIIHDLRTPLALEPFAKVLLDAPCSGTGTLRGHPEIRLRLSQDDIQNLVQLQSELLKNAWLLTQKGGTLIYAVCALTSHESIKLIASFLEQHKDAKAQPIQLLNTPITLHSTDYGSFVLPFSGLDGFFISVLQKAL